MEDLRFISQGHETRKILVLLNVSRSSWYYQSTSCIFYLSAYEDVIRLISARPYPLAVRTMKESIS